MLVTAAMLITVFSYFLTLTLMVQPLYTRTTLITSRRLNQLAGIEFSIENSNKLLESIQIMADLSEIAWIILRVFIVEIVILYLLKKFKIRRLITPRFDLKPLNKNITS